MSASQVWPRALLATLFYALLGGSVWAQTLVDSFPNGLSPGLGWQGDLAAFAGEGGRLVLREGRPSPQPVARLWLPAATQGAACWQLEVDQRFSASASNRVRWWLAADRALDQSSVQGVYLQLGGISGDLDAIELIAATPSGPAVIAGGAAGSAASDPLTLSIEVCAQANQSWSWTARDLAGQVLGSATGNAPQALNGRFSGFDVAFTASRSGLLSFDDFRVNPVFRDVTAPSLVLAKALSPNLVLLIASEALAASSTETERYEIGGAEPTLVTLQGDSLRLTLSQNLVSGQPTSVQVTGLADLAGNTAALLTSSVTYVAPRLLARYNVLISEVMADPSPVVGLPDAEYIELFNPTTQAISLESIRLDNGRVNVALPAFTLEPGAYRAFVREDLGDPRFTVFASLPALTNSGGTLRLLGPDATLLDELTYDDGFYRSGTGDGGYSLERLHLDQPCLLGADALESSEALAGGTPSAANSAHDALRPSLLSIVDYSIISPTSVAVQVNRALNTPTTSFSLNGTGPVVATESSPLGTYIVELPEALSDTRSFVLVLTTMAQSCVIEESNSTEGFIIGVAGPNQVGDWELNEIMFDPLSGQGRYVELANVSGGLRSLDGLTLARSNTAQEVLQRFEFPSGKLLASEAFVVLSADPISLNQQFPMTRQNQVLDATVPTLEPEDCLLLFDPQTEAVYFHVCYSEDWHNQAYAKTDGVSLERIRLSSPAQDANNWTSAASTVGFGTPTLTNSQVAGAIETGTNAFTLEALRVSPDGDGFEDRLAVNYAFGQASTLARFSIVDPRGYIVYSEAADVSVGSAGSWVWDGVDNDGQIVGVGTYVLRIEYWTPTASAKREYLNFSVLARL